LLSAALLPALIAVPTSAALAAGPLGSLSQLASPNNCIGSAPECGTTSTANLNGSSAIVVSPDGKNVYMLDGGSVSEFSRNADGSLEELAAPNDCIGSTSGCVTATGMSFANGIAISPDGRNVYVVGTDSNEIGAIVEFARNTNGSLTQLASPNDCIGETRPSAPMSACGTKTGHGLADPVAVAVSPDGANVYVADDSAGAIVEFARNANGSLTQLTGANNCIQEQNSSAPDCNTVTGQGLSNADSVSISPDGHNVYVAGSDTIAEFGRNANGSLAQLASPNNCIQEQADGGTECGTETGVGVAGIVSLEVSPDGRNLYSSEGNYTGAIGEFTRNANGSLTQLGGANNCIEENSSGDGTHPPEGCGTNTGHGLGEGGTLQVSPDGADVYVAATSDDCNEPCHAALAEFARNAAGSLTQLPSPNNCIEEQGGSDCGNETGHGLSDGSAGLAISPGDDTVYATGQDDIAEFARTLPVLTVSLSGPGSGTITDGTGAISCAPTCSHAYPIGSVVTLTATPRAGSGLASWSGGGCSGNSTCQVTMNADTAVTATFDIQSSPATVLTGAPAVTATGAGFSGSANPDGLPTTAVFQYGLDPKYSGGGPIVYTQSTSAQTVGSDFTIHQVSATVSGLVPNALYHVRLVATNAAGTTSGPDVTFTTAKAPAPGSPTLGKSFNISLVSGVVLVKVNGHFIPLTELTQIPKNTVIDALHGSLTLTSAAGGSAPAHDAAATGKKHKTPTQKGTFSDAIFKLSQATRGAGKGLVTLAIVENAFSGAPSYATRKAHTSADATLAKASTKTLQLLHASAKGKFATKGRYSAATVLGTKWTIADRCDGTLTHDITDSVAVTDFVHHKTIVLHAGQSYLAKAPKHK